MKTNRKGERSERCARGTPSWRARAEENGGQGDGEDSRWSAQSGSCPSPVERGASLGEQRSSRSGRPAGRLCSELPGQVSAYAADLERARACGHPSATPTVPGPGHANGARARVSWDVPGVPAGTNPILQKTNNARVRHSACGAHFYINGDFGIDGRGERRSGDIANDLPRKRPAVAGEL
ncbi:hypothetical protein HPB52_013584 [Rhipicephalus sanguineus]|uniref:Uncharacterized protein n=1 Tax=Rhipicephalus sanguineus TaxID=34632 RepID=A0A9D4PMS6_RHISA|nr:hypothetical protein HPB52_013584 [Rhipicephalus sanguineus]